MIPYVSFTRDNETIFGIGFPFSYTISEKLDLGAQAQFDFIPVGEGRDMSYFQTVVLGGPLVGELDFYLEGLATFFQSEQYLSANGGLIYNVSPNVKVKRLRHACTWDFLSGFRSGFTDDGSRITVHSSRGTVHGSR